MCVQRDGKGERARLAINLLRFFRSFGFVSALSGLWFGSVLCECVHTLHTHKWEFPSNDYWILLLSKYEKCLARAGNNPAGFLPILMSFHQMPVIMPLFFLLLLCTLFGHAIQAESNSNQSEEEGKMGKRYARTISEERERERGTKICGRKMTNKWHGEYPANNTPTSKRRRRRRRRTPNRFLNLLLLLL